MAALQLASDHRDPMAVWVVFAPGVGWSFVATGLPAWQAALRRIGALMVRSASPGCCSRSGRGLAGRLYDRLITSGLWGCLFLHLGLTFPTGRLAPAATARW